MSSSILRSFRAAAPSARAACKTSSQVVGRRAASSAAPFEVNAPYKFSNDTPWAIGSALFFIPLIAYVGNDLMNSPIWADHGHTHDDHDVHHGAKGQAEDNTFEKGTPKNAQKAKNSEQAPIENSHEAASAVPRSADGLDRKTTITDGKDDTRDPVAERSGEKETGQGIPKTVQEVKGESIKDTHASDHTKATQTATLDESRAAKGITKREDSSVQKGQEAEADKLPETSNDRSEAKAEVKGDESKSDESKSDEPTDKEVEESTEQALESDGDPAAAKKHEEETSS